MSQGRDRTGVAEIATTLSRAVESGLDAGEPREAGRAETVPAALLRVLARAGNRLAGDYREDEWGFDEEFTDAASPVLGLLHDRYWRVEASGLQHVPSRGRALLVANHAGALFPFDASMVAMAIRRKHPQPRWPRFMVLDWAFELPYLSYFMRKVGGVPANPYNAARLLEQEKLLMVFPEGAKGVSKTYSERYRLQRFGRGGFIEVALRTRAPIVPISIVGSEEIYPKLAESRTLARLLRMPYVPITPTFPWLGPLGLLPLPSRWRIEFRPPIDVGGYPPAATTDRALVFDLVEQVRDSIQEGLLDNLVKRPHVFR